MQKDTYKLEVAAHVDKIFLKLKKKDPKQLRIISSKICQIMENPEHFKPLRGDLSGARRAHIDKSFILIYEFKNSTVRILDYGHHDEIY